MAAPIKLHRTGVPLDVSDWTEADWRDLLEAYETAIRKISARHRPNSLSQETAQPPTRQTSDT